MTIKRHAVFAILIFCLATGLLYAKAPTEKRILEHFVSALGGRAALENVTSMVIRGTMEFPAMKASGTTVEYFKSPDRFAAVTEIPGYGTVRTVYDGHKGWQADPRGGVTEISGSELADVRRRSDIRWNLKLREFYPGLRVVGRDALEGKDAWKLEATVENWTYDFWFDVDSGLLMRFDTNRHAPEGTSSVKIGDYRRVGQVLFAFSAAQSSPSVNWNRKLTDVEFNEPIDDKVFAKPEENLPPKQ